MMRFVDGADRFQGLLLPHRLEDYVHEDNPVRVVDAFVEALDLSGMGFDAVNRVAGGGLRIIRPLSSRSTSTATSIAFNPADAWSEKRNGISSSSG